MYKPEFQNIMLDDLYYKYFNALRPYETRVLFLNGVVLSANIQVRIAFPNSRLYSLMS